MKPETCPRCGSDDIGQLDPIECQTDEKYEEMGGRWYCVTCAWIKQPPKPEGGVYYGRCPGTFCDGEHAWLFNSDCDEQPWCEGCIDEAHDRARDADIDPLEDLSPEEIYEEARDMDVGDEEPW